MEWILVLAETLSFLTEIFQVGPALAGTMNVPILNFIGCHTG